MTASGRRPIALVTGASRRRGIAAAIALGLAASGWDIATTYWRAYDTTMPWGSDPEEVEQLASPFGIRLGLVGVPSPSAFKGWFHLMPRCLADRRLELPAATSSHSMFEEIGQLGRLRVVQAPGSGEKADEALEADAVRHCTGRGQVVV